ncbi:hypothetical protein P1X15_14880 [Runella sp. MFBS21]|uniref:hypothetical protein n=1 Tax=Runella sp. MFBS21 TaxID=3034018 RepID=UPI0023F75851|nr:hypothetical protein [Runella sp. MFBS21]MDF7818898.1 hypothetical protein [Runella sp. MFBS21]
MKRFHFLILLLYLTGLKSYSQVIKLSEEPAQFIADVQKMMAMSGNPAYLKSAKNLETLWLDTRLTQNHQKSIVALTRRMVAKGYKPSTPHFEQLFSGLYSAFNGSLASPNEVEGYLAVASQVVETYDPKSSQKFFETARGVFENRTLYHSNFNKLFALEGTFSFKFINNQTPTSTTTPNTKPATTNDGWGDVVADSTGLLSATAYEKKPLPTVTGAVIEFKNVNLVMVTANDSVVLSQTNGNLGIKEGIWVGEQGKMTWEVAGGSPELFVTFTKYGFNTSLPKLSAEDVKLNYISKLSQPLEGTFEYESKRRPKGQPSSYPRFISYRNDANLKGLSKNVQYKGGLSLIGLKLIGTSLSQQPSTIIVTHDGKIAFKSTGRRFEFADSVIIAPLATFSAPLGQTDSLYHPGVRLTYNDSEGLVKSQRADRTGYKYTPYADSYHKMFIEAEMLRWSFVKKQIEFSVIAGKTVVPIRFESYSFFKPERFRSLSEQYGFHPLLMASNYIAKQKTPTFSSEEIAEFYKKDMNAVRGAYGQMMFDGYVEVDPKNGLLRLTDKGILNILANNKQTDFDNFAISSLYPANATTANASLDLKDNVLTIRGVEKFTVSDSLKIVAIPSDKEVKVFKNRDFMMNGRLISANFRFNGSGLAFNYDKFFVDLNKIDNITYIPKESYDKGGTTEVGGEVVYEKSGRIYLNDPTNKSGKKKNSVFPRLSVPEGMTVYFDQPDRGNLAYNRKVFFKIPSVDYDSLGSQDIVFIGMFNSDGIFPPFQAHLRSMPDNSLGFTYIPPAAGYKVYGTSTAVKFTKEIVMDKQGLRSQGEISHLSARIPTQSMLFMSDSLIASGAEAEIKEAVIGKAYFPKVDLRNYSLRWMPKADSMSLTTKGNTFNFYNGTTKLDGRIVLRSTGLYGKGFLRREDSELTSQDIKFNKEGFLAGESQYKIISATNTTRPVLLGQNVDVDFNIVKGIVGISTSQKSIENTCMEFPFASYRTSINRAQWNINAKTIAMKGDVATSTFTATAPEQEGLTFNGSSALYEIEKMTLNIGGVPFIKSADAKVLPDKGMVIVRRNGEMSAFKNARLVLDTLNEYHRLKNGNIQIMSRTKFIGDATYLYATVTNDTIPVKMGNFDLRAVSSPTVSSNSRTAKNAKNKVFSTVARAEIVEVDNFVIGPRLQYKGGMTMIAPEPNLQFDGYIKPIIKKRPDLVASWIPFKETPTKDVALKVTPELKNEADLPISVGLHFRSGADGLYNTFLSPKESRNDQDIFDAEGLLRFDEKTKVFKVVSEPKKADELIDEENAYTFNDAKGTITYQGKLNFVSGGNVKQGEEMFLAAGSVNTNIDSTTYRFNTLLSFNFPTSKEIIAKAGEKIVQTNLDEQNSDPAEPEFERLGAKLSALIGRKATDSYIARTAAAYKPLFDASPKFNATLVFSNVNLRWSAPQNAFYSVGKIGVSNIGSTDINAEMEGMIEIRKNPRGDEISIYIESSEDVWYYFDWQQDKLAMVSSDQELNDFIMVKSKDKKESTVLPIGYEERDLFVDRFNSLYRPKPKKPVVVKDSKTPTKTTAPKTSPNTKTAATAAPKEKEPVETTPIETKEEAEKVAEVEKTTLPTAKDKTSKDTKSTAKSTDPKAKPGAKVAQTPPKAPAKKKEKEEEKEGF